MENKKIPKNNIYPIYHQTKLTKKTNLKINKKNKEFKPRKSNTPTNYKTKKPKLLTNLQTSPDSYRNDFNKKISNINPNIYPLNHSITNSIRSSNDLNNFINNYNQDSNFINKSYIIGNSSNNLHPKRP